MAMTDRDDMELDGLFAEARDLRPAPGADLMARILADAEAVTVERDAPVPLTQVGWGDWIRALGGWPAVGGLVASTVAGLWIGVAPPAGLLDLAALVLGDQVSVTIGVDDDPLSLLEG